MKKLDREAFTLVELLAALVILGLLMAVAAPNVMGILNRSKNEMYIEDAKKLVARAEYVMRSDTSIQKPKQGGSLVSCVYFSLGYLDNSEFDDAPNGGEYYTNKSFVRVCNNGSYQYYVQLLECEKKYVQKGSNICQDGSNKNTTGYKGIVLTDQEELYKDDAAKKLVVNGSGNDFKPITKGDKTYCDMETGCDEQAAIIMND